MVLWRRLCRGMTKGSPGNQGLGVEGREERIGAKKLRINFTVVKEVGGKEANQSFKRTELL